MKLLEKQFDNLRRRAASPLAWIGLPLLLHVWSLSGPFCFDDLHLVLQAERYIAGESSDPSLFRFASTAESWQQLRDSGNYPWWSPADGRADFFRPLAEAAFYLDMYLFGRNAAAHRAMSLAVFALALVVLRRLFLRLGADPLHAGLATMMFGVSQSTAQPATFICNRSDLFVLIGVCIAAGGYWRMLASDGATPSESPAPLRSRLGLATLGFSFALLSKEIAIGWIGVIVFFEAWRRWRGDRATQPRLLAAFLCVMAIMVTAFLAYYDATRGGTAGARVELLTAAPRNVIFYLSVWLLGAPINLLTDRGWDTIVPLTAGVIVTLVMIAPHLKRLFATDPAARFFLCWAVAFGAMALLTQPEARALCLATPGWAYLLAHVLLPKSEHTSPVASPALSNHRQTKMPSLMLRHHLLFSNGGIGMAAAIGIVVVSMHAERQAQSHIQTCVASLATPLKDGDTLIVRSPNHDLEWLAAGDRLAFLTGRRDVTLHFLHAADARSTVARDDANTLRVTLDKAANDRAWAGRSWLQQYWMEQPSLLNAHLAQRMLGRDWTARVGTKFEVRGCDVEIARVDGDRITELKYRFKQPLDSAALRFVPPLN